MMVSHSLLLRLGGLAMAGAAVAAAAGCSSAGSSSTAAAAPTQATVTGSQPPAATTPPSSLPSSAPSSAPATSSPHAVTSPSSSASATSSGGGGAADGCATRDLQVKAGIAQGAAGSVYQVIDFTNIGNTTCTLYGYPGVSLAAGTPVAQIGAAASRSAAEGSPAVVTLKPGQTGNALLRITQAMNYASAACSPKTTTYLQIYPPNETTPVYLSYPSTGCTKSSVKLLTIGAVLPGAGSAQ
jgi:hypothetical protein